MRWDSIIAASFYSTSIFYFLQSELSVESLQQVNRNLEHKLSLAQTELTSTHASLASTRSDYDSYKVSRMRWTFLLP